MMRLRLAFAILALSGLLEPSALAVSPVTAGLADAKQGRVNAESLCSSCHLVAPDAERKDTQIAPRFEDVAGREGQSLERIAGAIIFPHPEMPSIPLTRAEIRDIATYIMSLKGGK